MSISNRLTDVFRSSKTIPFDNNSKIILMSDCHRGDNSYADNFAPNENITCAALNYYYKQGFTYIELGDGDDLWQFGQFLDIKEAHSRIFELFKKFNQDKRFYMIWGNHDTHKKDIQYTKLNLDGIEAYESLILKHSSEKLKIFLLHGHQADKVWGNNNLWKFNQFLMRNVWKPLEIHFGIKDPISPAKNYAKRDSVDKNIIQWVVKTKQTTIAGHTHRPVFPAVGEPPYFNTGCCVHPRSITGIEIYKGEITLVKWSIQVKEDGTLYAGKDILAGPQKLTNFQS